MTEVSHMFVDCWCDHAESAHYSDMGDDQAVEIRCSSCEQEFIVSHSFVDCWCDHAESAHYSEMGDDQTAEVGCSTCDQEFIDAHIPP